MKRTPPRSPPGWRASLTAACLLVWALTGGRATPAARGQAAEPLPTQQEIHQLFDEQKYAQALQKLSRVLMLKGPVAQGYDRHDLLRLKAETQLRLKSLSPALETFGEAARAAPDANSAAVDLATQLLIRRSQAGQYTPQTREPGKPAAPIPVLDLGQRRLALSALFRDELAAATPRIRALGAARSLAPVMEAMPTISSLHALELAATDGKAEQTKKLIADPAKAAAELMTTAVEDMKARVDTLETSANKVVSRFETERGPGPGGFIRVERWKKQGLNARDQSGLRDVEAGCEKIFSASRELAEILGPDGAALDAVRASAEKAGRKADAVLKADYSRAYNNADAR